MPMNHLQHSTEEEGRGWFDHTGHSHRKASTRSVILGWTQLHPGIVVCDVIASQGTQEAVGEALNARTTPKLAAKRN